jgi:molybdate transport system substrate-binding protein
LLLTTEPPYEEVISGKAELGFSTMAEIAAQPRVELAGPLPTEIQRYNVFTSARPVASKVHVATNDFLQFLLSDSSKRVLRSKGIQTD